ncbi:uncharacterized protein [Triticum aestivum]|uniref:DUF4220 domain-containing protein n=1 Tax=Triticum turgidum subsp. durum TaxID=4567 RepID=A0A9R1PDP0_TRITD|nr:uncharacterized protein LOC123043323 [Triticum aestivum]XP_044321675.1 uncharacterized protein LOC123043323 [Triticum aestivum]XP_044321676.1 uncharacterized protein LOC123043323 [Triticum aestivum]VAH40910.1 unnamed protein product [Triticum turgidum subsp. durum]
MARGPLDLWNEWGTRILVLLSLGFQVILHLFAKVRRRKASSAMQRFFLWLAYQLSDMTATYAAGQLFFSSTPQEHHLVAFWAPFLLLHLGGPDNITAYALEDSKLWKRHFLSLLVQVLGAGHVFYKHIIGSGILLMLAAILIFGLGVAKYGERTCALWFANFSRLRSSLKVLPRDKHHQKFYTEHQHGYDNSNAELLQLAHSLFHICKRGIVDSVMMVDPDSLSELDSLDNTTIQGLMKDRERMWTVMEMELSLMYDILYTKASVIHSWFGYCIRAVSPLAITASLVLFQLSGKDGDSQADVVVTYTLLVVALVLETKSLVGALGSSWVFAFLCATRCNWLRHAALCSGRWHWLRQRLGSLRRSWPGKAIITRNSRRWSGTMGQHNMLQFRTGEMDSTGHQLGSLFKMVGLSESFERRYYSWTVEVPEKVKERAQKVDDIVSTGDINTMGMLRYNWGKMALSEKKYPGLYMELEDWHGVDFHESIISWHIATDLILAAGQPSGHDAADGRVEAVRALSNYMMFLLVDRPDMLPGLPQNWLYKKTCTNLDDLCKERLVGSRGNIFTALKRLFGPRHHRRCLNPSKLEKELAGIILELPHEENFNYYETPRLMYARKIARILRRRDEDAVVVLLDVWTDFMAYAANRCSREAHARNLNSGGELTTVLWLMIEHLRLIKGDATKVMTSVPERPWSFPAEILT